MQRQKTLTGRGWYLDGDGTQVSHAGSLHAPCDWCKAASPIGRWHQLFYLVEANHLSQVSDTICMAEVSPCHCTPHWGAGWHTWRVAGGGSCCRSPSTMDVPLRRWFMKRTSASRRKSCRGQLLHVSFSVPARECELTSHAVARSCSCSRAAFGLACRHANLACQDAGQAVRQAGSKRMGLHLCCCPTWNVIGMGPGAGLGACAAAFSSRRAPIGVCESFSPPAIWPADPAHPSSETGQAKKGE